MKKQEKKPTIECPYCGEEILATAKKCKHCGEFLDDELRKQNSNNTGNVVNIGNTTDYTGCQVIKRGLFEGTPIIECPKCGYQGKANYQRGSYSGCLFFILLCCGIIPGLLYYVFASGGKYTCPQCGVDHLRKLKSSTSLTGILLIIMCVLFFLLPAITMRNAVNTHNSLSNQVVKPSVAEITKNRINYVYESFGPNGTEKREEFESMECKGDCAVADVELKLNAEPKDLDVNTIARGQTLNLAKELKKGIGADIAAYVSVYVKGVLKEKCKGLGNSIDFSFGNNGCEVY